MPQSASPASEEPGFVTATPRPTWWKRGPREDFSAEQSWLGVIDGGAREASTGARAWPRFPLHAGPDQRASVASRGTGPVATGWNAAMTTPTRLRDNTGSMSWVRLFKPATRQPSRALAMSTWATIWPS